MPVIHFDPAHEVVPLVRDDLEPQGAMEDVLDSVLTSMQRAAEAGGRIKGRMTEMGFGDCTQPHVTIIARGDDLGFEGIVVHSHWMAEVDAEDLVVQMLKRAGRV
jgi:hypothetical protein